MLPILHWGGNQGDWDPTRRFAPTHSHWRVDLFRRSRKQLLLACCSFKLHFNPLIWNTPWNKKQEERKRKTKNNNVNRKNKTVIERLREDADPKAAGMVHANGMFLTKEAIGIYGKVPPKRSWQDQFVLFPAFQKAILQSEQPPLAVKGNGPFKLLAYTIVHSRKTHKPKSGIALGILGGTGQRAYAFLDSSGFFHFLSFFFSFLD